ncbi:MAG: MogA/MoaB family molybdenum cofactor biosynthesis protein [Ornithinimicrobium sp.]|uniref:MogA/MoaB family molybdenum cofactor biosynthesis protein n=1 Tax=Ornithinimicrobium sp. TaxID=1977084 RepID=UPI003D9ADB9A
MSSPDPQSVPTLVLTVSDRSAAGTREDTSGARLVELLTKEGYAVNAPVVIPDGRDSVRDALRIAVRDGIRLVLSTGGTGIAPRDFTPEGTRDVVTRELDGVAEYLRRHGEQYTVLSYLSRGVVGVVDPGADAAPGAIGTLVINLPGSPKAMDQSMEVLAPLLPHLLAMVVGWDDH